MLLTSWEGFMYIHREIEQTLRAFLAQFKCVLVTGVRQTGKITMLQKTLGDEYARDAW